MTFIFVCALVHMWRAEGNWVLNLFSSSTMWVPWFDSGRWFGSNLCFYFLVFEMVFYSPSWLGLNSLHKMTLNLCSPCLYL